MCHSWLTYKSSHSLQLPPPILHWPRPPPSASSQSVYWPISDQHLCHVISVSQEDASIQVMWSLSANRRPVSRSGDCSRPMRGRYQPGSAWGPAGQDWPPAGLSLVESNHLTWILASDWRTDRQLALLSAETWEAWEEGQPRELGGNILHCYTIIAKISVFSKNHLTIIPTFIKLSLWLLNALKNLSFFQAFSSQNAPSSSDFVWTIRPCVL